MDTEWPLPNVYMDDTGINGQNAGTYPVFTLHVDNH